MVVKHIVSFSGGKDSTAMLLRMLELGMQIDEIVFADTFMEFPEMYQFITRVQSYIDREIKILKTCQTWDKWFYGKITRGNLKGKQRGFPLTLFPCWWSRESKFKVLDPVCEGHIRYIGITHDEPKRIHERPGYRYPLNEWGWTERDCMLYLIEKGIYAELHTRFQRTGCWCCPKQSEKSLRALHRYYPDLWDKLKIMESESPNGFKPGIRLLDLENKFNNSTEPIDPFGLRTPQIKLTDYCMN